MKQYILTLCIVLATCLSGCKDDMESGNEFVNRNPGNGLPITFITELVPMEKNGDAQSRSDIEIEDNYKKEFQKGDYLHVIAIFTVENTDHTTTEQEPFYDCFQFDGTEWKTTATAEVGTSSPMTWPWNAIEADFTAYYISASDGRLTKERNLITSKLETLTDVTDPLVANATNIKYGHAVPLTFHHLCTKLTITDITSGSNEFWAKKGTDLKDAFQLFISPTTGEFQFDFIKEGTEEPRVSSQRIEKDNTSYVSYYLAPGDYKGMQLTYRYSRPYLTLNIDKLNNLEAEKSYIVSIIKNSGNISIDDDEDNRWDDPDNPDENTEVKVDINEFLQHICEGTAYQVDNTTVLNPSLDGGIELLVNVDFENKTFNSFTLPNGALFNGNYHYIKNVCQPLFEGIEGVIANLHLANVNIAENQNETNTTNIGAFCRTSSASSAINNIRLSSVKIAAKPNSTADLCNFGALVGYCAGDIETVQISKDVTSNVYTAEENENENLGRIYVGGLVGELSGSLRNVSRFKEETGTPEEEQTKGKVTVTCNCPNKIGERYTGGIVGLSTGDVANCTLEATVNASNARGVLVYTGGIAGMARYTEETEGISNCIFKGDIHSGLAYSTEDGQVEGHAYTGGLAGFAAIVGSITNNEIYGTLHGPTENGQFTPLEHSVYAMGGLYGQIYQSSSSNNTTWITFEDLYTGEDNNYHVGKIAGRADEIGTGDTSKNTETTLGDVGSDLDNDDIDEDLENGN